jgi:Fic family protein
MATKRLRRTTEQPLSETHPWINFNLNLTSAPVTMWMLIGEAASKCQHILGAPLDPVRASDLYEIYLAKGIHATTSIEGNTLSEQQVKLKLAGKLTLPKSQEYMGNEVQNILDACNEITNRLYTKREPMELTRELICHFNGIVLRGLELEEGVVPGETRRHDVGVMGYRGAPWRHCDEAIDDLCDWLGQLVPPSPEYSFAWAVMKSVLAHLYIAWIHPFGDGNGRTARLVEFLLLAKSGIPLPATQLLSNHYNQTRPRYYVELDKSSKDRDGVVSFIHYAIQGFVDGLRGQLDSIRQLQWDVAWEKFVYDSFRDKNTQACHRQKILLLDMPDVPVSKKLLPRMSPRVAAEYASKGGKTLSRDINQLLGMKLIKRTAGFYQKNKDLLLATWKAPACDTPD